MFERPLHIEEVRSLIAAYTKLEKRGAKTKACTLVSALQVKKRPCPQRQSSPASTETTHRIPDLDLQTVLTN